MNAQSNHALESRAAQITAELATFTPYDWHGRKRYHYEDVAERMTNEVVIAADLYSLIALHDYLSAARIGSEFSAIVRRCILAQAADDLETDEHAPMAEEERDENERDMAAEINWAIAHENA